MKIPWFSGRRIGRCDHCRAIAVLQKNLRGHWLCAFDTAFFEAPLEEKNRLLYSVSRWISPAFARVYGPVVGYYGYGRIPAAWEVED